MFNERDKKILCLSFAVVVFLFGIALFLLSINQGTTLRRMCHDFSRFFFLPHINNFRPGVIAGRNVNHLFYYIVVAATLIVSALQWKFFRKDQPVNGLKTFFITAFSVYVLMTLCQTVSLYRYFAADIRQFYGRPVEDRCRYLYGHIYLYARACRQVLPGKHTAELVTDMDMSRDPGMFSHRALAYFLYPIDIRGIRGEPPDCLVIFRKQDARSHVPPGYEVVLPYDGQSLLAVKKAQARLPE